tara:strand:+ start:49 stop:483 length:435 start_codon:yes stop_codon:yes gene_type:complete
MSWLNVLKTPTRINTEVEFMLNTIFNIPPEILPTLNIPNNLVQRMRLERNLEAINEQQFDRLLQLAREGKYQELLDTLVVLLDATKPQGRTPEQKKYLADKAREYRKTPEYQKYIRQYRQQPEVKEREKLRARERRRVKKEKKE